MDQEIDRSLEVEHEQATVVGKSGKHRDRPDSWTILSFVMLIFLVAANGVAIRFTNRELPPFWGAGTRFVAASVMFLIYALARRLPLPRGRALTGVVIFGVLQFGIGFALGYWAFQRVPAGLGSVILASIPLFTLVLAFITRIEPFRLRGLLGSMIAIAGIAAMVGERAGQEIPLKYLLAMVGTALVFSLVPVVIKAFPPVHLAVANGVGMIIGASLLLLLSLNQKESLVFPNDLATWIAYLYLIVPGSIGVFALLLFVLKRWTATAVSYQTVLSPIVAIALAAFLLGEPVTGGLFLGSVLVLAGVYIGALAPGR